MLCRLQSINTGQARPGGPNQTLKSKLRLQEQKWREKRELWSLNRRALRKTLSDCCWTNHSINRSADFRGSIFPFPSGWVTWWRCSQRLEPKENARQGDEVLLLSRHLIPAGWYCDLGLIYSFRSRSVLWEQWLSTSRNKEGGRQTQRDLERTSRLLSFQDRSFTNLVGTVTPWEGPLLLGFWRSASWRHYKAPSENENIEGLAVHHGHH